MASVTQADLDKLDKAIALGVLRVTYTSGTVEYQSIDAMLKARAHIADLLGSGTAKASMTSLVEFHRC
jgi:hypothetical protein